MAEITSTCSQCGAQFTYKRRGPGRSRATCSEACRTTRANTQTALSKERLALGLRRNRPSAAKGRPKQKKNAVDCAHCGAAFRTYRLRDEGNFCTKKCRDAFFQSKATRELHADIGTRSCGGCGESFQPRQRGGVYCSERCRRVVDNQTRNARRHRADVRECVSPRAVFERDGWRCQLCGVRVHKSKRGSTHPRAPELDHILPLSKGGDHTYRNTQCACRACNSSKGATPMGQTLLFG